jgi:ribonuclease-3
LLDDLESRVFYKFKDKELLRLALRHKSHANEERKKVTSSPAFVNLHNERLEFLGDAVLGLVISDLLSDSFPQSDEGRLSKMRSSLVKADTLAAVARSIDLGKFLLLGKGEITTKGQEKDSILSSAYEALLGAIYLDGGLPKVFETTEKHFKELLKSCADLNVSSDYKTDLQELAQARFRKSPAYKVVAEEGPDHEKIFEVMVSIGSFKRYGKGRNKKEAEQAAAHFLLEHLINSADKDAHA